MKEVAWGTAVRSLCESGFARRCWLKRIPMEPNAEKGSVDLCRNAWWNERLVSVWFVTFQYGTRIDDKAVSGTKRLRPVLDRSDVPHPIARTGEPQSRGIFAHSPSLVARASRAGFENTE